MSSVGEKSLSRDPSTESEFSADQHLVEALVTQVDEETVQSIIDTQKDALRRFEKSNEMLATVGSLSAQRLERARKEAAASKELLKTMKADLESVFKRIRLFKQSLAAKYPEVYAQMEAERRAREHHGEEDD